MLTFYTWKWRDVSAAAEVWTDAFERRSWLGVCHDRLRSGNTIAEIAALIGEAARANMLSALMGGKALTAGRTALHAGVSAQTTSGHLAKLSESGLIALEKQGRHRYYRLASAEIAHAMEALMAVAGGGPKRHRPFGPKDEAMRTARTCYDHMAGRLGIAIADALSAKRFVIVDDGAAAVTRKGREFSAISESIWSLAIAPSARSARPASTGASGGRISRDGSARRCSTARSHPVGSRAFRRAAHSRSPLPAKGVSSRSWVFQHRWMEP